jgi:hypothetical protein
MVGNSDFSYTLNREFDSSPKSTDSCECHDKPRSDLLSQLMYEGHSVVLLSPICEPVKKSSTDIQRVCKQKIGKRLWFRFPFRCTPVR